MKTILAFLLLTASALAQCGPQGCPPRWCPPQPQWQPTPSVGVGGNIGGFGLGIGAGISVPQPPRLQQRHVPGSVIRIGDSGGFFSGVIVSADGLILTAKHCLILGEPVFPVLNGKKLESRVLYEAPETEGPVVLKVEMSGLPASRVADTLSRVGDPAYTIGYPNNQPTSVMASGRMQMPQWWYREDLKQFPSSSAVPGAWRASQLNAATTGGMSGGPLFNANGEVIGLLSADDGIGSSFIGLAAIHIAMKAAATAEDHLDAPAVSGGPAPLWESTPEPTPILETIPQPVQPTPIVEAPKPEPIKAADIAAELAAQIKPEIVQGQAEQKAEVGKLGSLVEKLHIAVKAIGVVAPVVGLELPWWLGAAAATGPVGIGVGAAFFGIKTWLKWRASRKQAKLSEQAAIPVARPVQAAPEQVVQYVWEPPPQPSAPPVPSAPPETVIRHQIVPNALESASPQLVPVAVASDELKRLHEAMAHVAKTTYGAAAVQDILSAAQQLKNKVPSLA